MIKVANNVQLNLNDYRERIDLDIPFIPELEDPITRSQYYESIENVTMSLLIEPDSYIQGIQTAALDKKRAYIKTALTLRPPYPLSEEVEWHMNLILQYERMFKNMVTAANIKPARCENPSFSQIIPEQISLWKGDITELDVDVIVNAANSRMLGCFQPYHACIDNAIHCAAGPRLRADCATIMELQGHAEPTGTSKITRAYNLPSRYVLHTVGPIIQHGTEVEADQKAQLASCYNSCLSLASQIESIRSIAFCGISTGVFGYPKKDAAQVAVTEVIRWLNNHPGHFDQVIFNVFSDEDRFVYETIFREL